MRAWRWPIQRPVSVPTRRLVCGVTSTQTSVHQPRVNMKAARARMSSCHIPVIAPPGFLVTTAKAKVMNAGHSRARTAASASISLTHVCECVGPFGGDNCEHRQTCADSPCANDEFPVGVVATCTDHTESMFTCGCPDGFQGDRCEISVNRMCSCSVSEWCSVR